MKIALTPRLLKGKINAVPSKSDAHRKLICAALAENPGRVGISAFSQDLEATVACLSALGAAFCIEGEGIAVTPGKWEANPLLHCGESGTTLRFLLPVAAALCGKARFSGDGRLPQRPLDPLCNAMADRGVEFSGKSLPFSVKGKLQPGLFTLPGDVSSQFISGLLMAMPLLSGQSRLRLSSPLQSENYVKMTLATLSAFGVKIEAAEGGWDISGVQKLIAPSFSPVEGDWSNAAFFLCAAALSGSVTVAGLDASSLQGDKAILEILGSMGANIVCGNEGITVTGRELRGIEVDVANIPDLLPILAVTATAAKGETRFTGGARLRFKESDRLAATAALLNSLGGEVKELANGLMVKGKALRGGTVRSYGDHRIVMAAAVAAMVCREEVFIDGAEAVAKSYPTFFEDYRRLGGVVAKY